MKKKILIIISIIIVGVAAVFGFSNSDIVRDRVETIEEQTLYGCPSSKKNKKRWSKWRKRLLQSLQALPF